MSTSLLSGHDPPIALGYPGRWVPRTVTEQLRLRADGAALALRELEAAERDARNALDAAQEQVRCAIGDVLLEAVRSDIEQLRRARAEYLDARARVTALRLVASTRWGPVSRWHRLVSGIESYLAQVLRESAIREPTERELFERAHEDAHAQRRATWAKALATDSDAEMAS